LRPHAHPLARSGKANGLVIYDVTNSLIMSKTSGSGPSESWPEMISFLAMLRPFFMKMDTSGANATNIAHLLKPADILLNFGGNQRNYISLVPQSTSNEQINMLYRMTSSVRTREAACSDAHPAFPLVL
jgi:hypothetical protein